MFVKAPARGLAKLGLGSTRGLKQVITVAQNDISPQPKTELAYMRANVPEVVRDSQLPVQSAIPQAPRPELLFTGSRCTWRNGRLRPGQ
ncbi:hypothetical protein EBQ74_00435 [bacterium]|nr:hypothetical protein [bacterium]